MALLDVLAAIPAPPTNQVNIGPLRITFYGVLIATGVLIAMTMTRKRWVERGGDAEFADRVAFRAVALGFVGARLAYVLPRLDYFVANPLEVFAVWRGGLALFGGLTLGLLTVVALFRRSGGDWRSFLDATVPGVAVAQALGRWGNYFNQELYGTPTTLPWALEVDPEYRVVPFREFATFHPTFLYESLWNLGLAAFLIWLDRRRVLPRGGIALTYAIGYSVARFGLELLRTDTTYRFLGLSRNGWVSLAVAVGATVLLAAWTRRAGRRGGLEPEPEPAAVES